MAVVERSIFSVLLAASLVAGCGVGREETPAGTVKTTSTLVLHRLCPIGLTDCSGTCADLSNDEANCGVCGVSCAAWESCIVGECKATAYGYAAWGPWHGSTWAYAAPDTGLPATSSTITPEEFSGVPFGGPFCVEGTVRAMEDWSSFALLGYSVNSDPGGDAGTWTPTRNQTLGVDLSGDTTGLRVQIQGPDGDTNPNDLWCGNLDGRIDPQGHAEIPFSEFNTKCWDNSGDYYAGEALEHAVIVVPGHNTDTVSFDFCLHRLEPLCSDLEISPPDPPLDGELNPFTISNPLQRKARECLDKGYNIGLWLEAQRFSDFTYDEKFVNMLADAGFKSLRLPIDLDLYVIQNNGVFGLVLHPDLFLILDSFANWTKKYGLSLTIDYHQYDGSFDPDDPDNIAEMGEIWSQVAAHFANDTRKDLFYELLNEPVMSAGAIDPAVLPQAQWTAIAEYFIDRIRAHDTRHTVIFGDTGWYSISDLVNRAPLSYTNVIYAFHFYDPYVFTTQGGAWAGMGETHAIPYPYSEGRWSECSHDFGFTLENPDWQFDCLDDYAHTGNKSWIRNRIVEAKRWAVKHNVPVICNEFGVYEGSVQPEDEIRYYTDLIDVFTELEIPWQHWYMIMDSGTGEVKADLRAALHLDQ